MKIDRSLVSPEVRAEQARVNIFDPVKSQRRMRGLAAGMDPAQQGALMRPDAVESGPMSDIQREVTKMIPYVGAPLAALDAVKEGRAGNYGKAALEAVSMVPASRPAVLATAGAAHAVPLLGKGVAALATPIGRMVEAKRVGNAALIKDIGEFAGTVTGEVQKKLGFRRGGRT